MLSKRSTPELHPQFAVSRAHRYVPKPQRQICGVGAPIRQLGRFELHLRAGETADPPSFAALLVKWTCPGVSESALSALRAIGEEKKK